jgi:hypothetical protein
MKRRTFLKTAAGAVGDRRRATDCPNYSCGVGQVIKGFTVANETDSPNRTGHIGPCNESEHVNLHRSSRPPAI